MNTLLKSNAELALVIDLAEDQFPKLRESFTKLSECDFIRSCENKTLSKKSLYLFFEQHAFYSQYFVKFLLTMMSKLDDSEEIKVLLENIHDEMGLDEGGAVPHSVLYERFIQKLGLSKPNNALPETDALVKTMLAFCSHEDPFYGLCALCLGAEAIVPLIYSSVLKAMEAHNIQEGAGGYFGLHIGCDDEHAQIMYDMILDRVRKNPSLSIEVYRVANSMFNHRINFLNALLK